MCHLSQSENCYRGQEWRPFGPPAFGGKADIAQSVSKEEVVPLPPTGGGKMRLDR
jgi:hypothetical protein